VRAKRNHQADSKNSLPDKTRVLKAREIDPIRLTILISDITFFNETRFRMGTRADCAKPPAIDTRGSAHLDRFLPFLRAPPISIDRRNRWSSRCPGLTTSSGVALAASACLIKLISIGLS